MVKPIEVTVMDDYRLLVTFVNDEKKIFNFRPYLELPFYKPLQDIKIFNQVFISDAHVQWPNGRDISPHELYENSSPDCFIT